MATLDELRQKRRQTRRKRKRAREARSNARDLRVPKGVRKPLRRLRERLRALVDALTERFRSIKRRIRRKRNRIVTTPGAPHWGGSDDILRLEVEPVARNHGLSPNSAKRSETYGNPGSDHHTSQTLASARDFPTANDYALRDKIAVKVVGRPVSDYENVYFTRDGVRYRFQAIAGTHGTGPHLHIGIRRA